MAKKLLPLRNFGRFGVVHDTASQAMPIGTWSDALNMRFSGVEMEKMLEPELFAPFLGEGYSCSALDDHFKALSAAGDALHWSLLDLPDHANGDTAPESSGGSALLSTGNNDVIAAVPPLSLDLCGTQTVRFRGATGIQQYVYTGSDIWGGGSMSYHITLDFAGDGAGLWSDLTKTSVGGTTSLHEISLRYSSNALVGTISGGVEGAVAINFPVASAEGPHSIVVTVDVTDNVGPITAWTVSLWINNTLANSVNYTNNVGWTWDLDDPANEIRLTPDNGNHRFCHAALWQGQVVPDDTIDAIYTATQRNLSTYVTPGVTGNPKWMQLWSDGFSSYVAIVLEVNQQDYLYWLDRRSENDTGAWVEVGGPYATNGVWHSFEWGDTCIFNNGVNAPQMWDGQALQFVDLPNWGLISTAEDISNNRAPSRDRQAACRVLVPFKNYLVACGVTEGGTYYPNKVWWSDTITFATYNTAAGGGPPSWDYESPSTNSGQSEVGLGDGKIRAAAVLNENLIIYADKSATAMQIVGGRFIMRFVRLFGKGAAAIHCVAEFNSRHFVVARDQIYVHDGSIPQLIAKDRVEEEFFIRCGKGGRFGSGTVDWDKIQVVKNPDRKEILVCFDGEPGYGSQLETPPLPECLGYSCNALLTELYDTADSLYLSEDPTWPQVDVIASRDLVAINTQNFGVQAGSSVWGASGCQAQLHLRKNSSSSAYIRYQGADAFQAKMHAGIVTRDLPTNGDGLFLMSLIIRADLGNGTGNEANSYSIFVDQSGATAQPRIRLQTGFDGVTDNYVDLPLGTDLSDTHVWVLEIDVVGEVSPVVTQRAYMDGALVHTGTQTHDVSQVFRYDNALNGYLFLDRATNFDYGPIWINFGPVTTALLDTYRIGFERNFSTYTPPEYCNV